MTNSQCGTCRIWAVFLFWLRWALPLLIIMELAYATPTPPTPPTLPTPNTTTPTKTPTRDQDAYAPTRLNTFGAAPNAGQLQLEHHNL